jgi:hypothetical protein
MGDDLYISFDDSMVARYLDVFRRVFDKTEHQGHYKMMMGPDLPADPAEAAVSLEPTA